MSASASCTAKSGPSFARRFWRAMRAKSSLYWPMLIAQITLGAAILTAWQQLVNAGRLDKFFFSRPTDIALRIAQWLRTGSIWPHLLTTIEEAALGFLL